MKKKIEALLKRLQIAVQHNPAEVVLSVLFCCFGCALYETSGQDWLLSFITSRSYS